MGKYKFENSSGHIIEVWRGQRHTLAAVPGHCTLQAGLQLHCLWHNIEYRFKTTGQHSQLCIETGNGSDLYQPNLQPVHRGERLLWRNVGYSYPCITIWKLVLVLTIQHIMSCMHLTEPLEISMSPSQMGAEAWPAPDPWCCSHGRDSRGLCRDQCRIGLPFGYTQFSTRNTR